MLRNTHRYFLVCILLLLTAAGVSAQAADDIQPDSVEPDGPGSLVSLTIDGEPQRFSLHDESDSDWFVFATEPGNDYAIIVTPEVQSTDLEIGVFGFGWTTYSFHGKAGEDLLLDDVAYESYRPKIFGDGYTGYYTIQIVSVP